MPRLVQSSWLGAPFCDATGKMPTDADFVLLKICKRPPVLNVRHPSKSIGSPAAPRIGAASRRRTSLVAPKFHRMVGCIFRNTVELIFVWFDLEQMPMHAAAAPHSNPTDSEIVRSPVVFWADANR